MDRRQRRRRGLYVLVRLPARRGGTEPTRALRGIPHRRLPPRQAAFLLRQLRRPDGPAPALRAPRQSGPCSVRNWRDSTHTAYPPADGTLTPSTSLQPIRTAMLV